MSKVPKVNQQNASHLQSKNHRCLQVIFFIFFCTMFYYSATNWLGLTINRNFIDFFSGLFSSLTLVLVVYIVRNQFIMKRYLNQ
ncbi:hypothetical protein [Enterococcus sp. AZ072]|uniref:hypothetical protein n=1 Tax=unclassified Enterococcus TaxID=2608891 RepID=UPI003D2E7B97